MSGVEEDLCDGRCDGKQHETHGDGHEEHDGFPVPRAQQWGYFALDLRGHMAGGVNPVADKSQSQTVKCEYDKEGDDVALQSLQPNQGVDEKKAGLCGCICIWSGCCGGLKHWASRKEQHRDG